MEERQELQELLKRLDESNRQQAKYARWQCILSVAAAVCCVGLFVLVWQLMPQVQELTGQMETVLTNLETVTAQLAGMDLGEMVRNVDDLVVTSQAGVEETMAKLNSIDFNELNRAIGNLSDVVEPMAKFFNVFR
jgi:uncharacterized protein YoxC